MLRDEGIVVDLLPTTIPSQYLADSFVSIHADGNLNPFVSGFKIVSSSHDLSGNSNSLLNLLYDSYSLTTGLSRDPNVTDSMKNYYAFNWRKYRSSIHPFTPAVIIETGFITNTGDQRILIHKPEFAAQGIADGILNFLRESGK